MEIKAVHGESHLLLSHQTPSPTVKETVLDAATFLGTPWLIYPLVLLLLLPALGQFVLHTVSFTFFSVLPPMLTPWIQSCAFDFNGLHHWPNAPVETELLFSKHIWWNSHVLFCHHLYLLKVFKSFKTHLRYHLHDKWCANSHLFFWMLLALIYLIHHAFPTLKL